MRNRGENHQDRIRSALGFPFSVSLSFQRFSFDSGLYRSFYCRAWEAIKDAAEYVGRAEAVVMKTHLVLFAMVAAGAIFLGGCATTEPTSTTTTTTHTERTSGGY
jgi:hypothetical protein